MSYYRNALGDLIYNGSEYVPITPQLSTFVSILSDGTNSWPIKAVAQKNQNSASGALTEIYDWVGTKDEYEAQNIATEHPEWICFVEDGEEVGGALVQEVSERRIGETVYSLVPISDAGLHLLDGDVLDGTGIYKAFYDYMVSISTTYASIFTNEAAWQTSVTTYGVCGKFVLNTTNHTIRLPKVTGFIEGTVTRSEIGNLVQAGLPNITGVLGQGDCAAATYNVTRSGAFYTANANSRSMMYDRLGASNNYGDTGFDASRSSSIYGNSTTVQPQSIKGYIYMVVGNAVKTPIVVDIDNIVTDLNGKVAKGHEVIAFQEPTSSNSYTWYRKYADGWVEQGGYKQGSSSTYVTITLPVVMADTNYYVGGHPLEGANNSSASVVAKPLNTRATTTVQFISCYQGNFWKGYFVWQVSGMAAS